MNLDNLPLNKIRLVQQDTQASRAAVQKTSSALTEEKIKLEQRLRKLNELLRTQGRDIQLLKLAGNIRHCFPGPYEELRKQIIAQRIEAVRKDITVAESEAANAKLEQMTSELQRRCPHNLVFGHYDIYEYEYSPPKNIGHRVCAFCGIEETKYDHQFHVLNDDRTNLVMVYIRPEGMDRYKKDAENGKVEQIVLLHQDYKAMMKLLESLDSDE